MHTNVCGGVIDNAKKKNDRWCSCDDKTNNNYIYLCFLRTSSGVRLSKTFFVCSSILGFIEKEMNFKLFQKNLQIEKELI